MDRKIHMGKGCQVALSQIAYAGTDKLGIGIMYHGQDWQIRDYWANIDN